MKKAFIAVIVITFLAGLFIIAQNAYAENSFVVGQTIISGRILNPDGTPFEMQDGTYLSVRLKNLNSSYKNYLKQVDVNDDGTYELAYDYANGEYELVVLVAGKNIPYVDSLPDHIKISSGQKYNKDLKLSYPEITGKILTKEGTPLEIFNETNIRVDLWNNDESFHKTIDVSSDGSYNFGGGLPSGKYVLRAFANGNCKYIHSESINVNFEKGNTIVADIPLEKANATGKILKPDGTIYKPEGYAYSLIYIDKVGEDTFGKYITGVYEGYYNFGKLLDEGDYIIRLIPMGDDNPYTASEPVIVHFSPDETVIQDLVYTSPMLKGKILSPDGKSLGDNVAGIEVELRSVEEPYKVENKTTVNKDGSYSIGGVPSGTYILKAINYDIFKSPFCDSMETKIILDEKDVIVKDIKLSNPNSSGQLGNGTNTNSTDPVQVNGLNNIKAIYAGANYSFAIENNGTVWAWGEGISTSSFTPIQLKGLSDIKAIAAGRDHILVLKNDGTVWTLGDNGSGQNKDGTNVRSIELVEVKGLSDVKEITSGAYHNLVLKNDGTVWAWGENWYGQLGDGTTEKRSTPVLSIDITAPTVPSNLTAAIEEHIVLKWQPSEDGDRVAGYEIYRNDVRIDTVNETKYIDKGAQIDKTYKYKVIAFDVAGNKSEAIIIVINDILPPSKPSNLVVASKTPTTVSLEWEDSTDNMWVEGYEIYRNGEKVGISKSTNYTDTAVPNDSTYVYVVKAYDISGNLSKESNTVTVTTESLNGVPLAAGGNHSLHVKSDGTVWAWGYNSNGELGDGTTIGKTVSTQVKDLQDIVAVSANDYHSLALKNDGTVWAWGANWYGQLGDGTTTKSTKPIQIKDLNDAKAIAAGRDHNLALKNDGTVWAWGDNGYGQLGDGTTTDSNLPIQVKELNDVKAIAVGQSYSLAIKNDGTVWAWGHNYYEQLGDGTKDDRVTPVMSKDITAPTKPSDILTIIEENNVVLKWQPSIDGDKVAYYEIYRDDVLVGTVNDTEYKDIDAQINKKNIYMVIAVDASGNKSEPGFNDIIQPSKPLNLVAAPKTPTTVSLEWEASTDNDEIEGYEIYRNGVKVGYSKETNYTDTALPHNSTYTYTVRAYDRSYNLSEESNTVTVTTESLTDVSLAAGENYSLQVKSDGTVWAWGYNARGQLGDETTIDKTASRQVKDLKDIVAVAAGESHSLALRSDGTVWAWGYNGSGQLGDGTTKSSNIPIQVKDLRDIKAIAAGRSHSLALRSDGTVWAWGYNGSGQLGDGTTKSSNTPIQVKDLRDIKAIAAG
ncbi:MAG TPA: hypothetical protein PK566_17840 [Pseudobacteroides sp.]|nr:hypothetical protein [Pseudobacteroides sp.]